ncbi:hypothetical protein GCM10025864_17820 [Luteimicrobium album]|uniref:Molybdopterin molybdenumtransferase n=1 Tax=Luteimicrobium album TaxID=1054550 RepID=A0ABQ6I268_9MICO|nr:gephyrin-like molybdotransferase Glp [Luteimicrobium album]GMA24023.1 hypothetical protein GCM10025864_17820 [Luteimicrobium album]
MDGYALRRADTTGPVTLRVVGEVAAGTSWQGTLAPGETVRIMTGAPLPDGADVVVPVERTSTGTFAPDGARPDATDVTVPALSPGDRAHVRRRGEDVAAGDVVAPAGTVVTARLAALAAALGHATLAVHRAPVVAVLSTGGELTPAGAPLGPGRIPDSNSVLVAGAVRDAGACALRTGGVPDTPEALAAALDAAVGAGADLIVTTGGVSVGAHDVVRTLLATPPGPDAGASDVDVAAVGMQPGKPQALARWRGVPWLAAPGNPTGAYASFELFVRPMLARLRGLAGDADGADDARVVAEGWRSPRDRQQLVPVRTDDDGRVAPVGDGHRLSALALADGLAVVPADVVEVRAGDTVAVRRFAAAGRPRTGTAPGVVFDAVVLAGGRAQRLGVPKPGVTLAGRTLLDHALAAARDARRTVVVGPAELARDGVTVVREDPPFGGRSPGSPPAWPPSPACTRRLGGARARPRVRRAARARRGPAAARGRVRARGRRPRRRVPRPRRARPVARRGVRPGGARTRADRRGGRRGRARGRERAIARRGAALRRGRRPGRPERRRRHVGRCGQARRRTRPRRPAGP